MYRSVRGRVWRSEAEYRTLTQHSLSSALCFRPCVFISLYTYVFCMFLILVWCRFVQSVKAGRPDAEALGDKRRPVRKGAQGTGSGPGPGESQGPGHSHGHGTGAGTGAGGPGVGVGQGHGHGHGHEQAPGTGIGTGVNVPRRKASLMTPSMRLAAPGDKQQGHGLGLGQGQGHGHGQGHETGGHAEPGSGSDKTHGQGAGSGHEADHGHGHGHDDHGGHGHGHGHHKTKQNDSLVDIFLFSRPWLFFKAVEVLELYMSFYIAVTSTQIIPLVIRTAGSEGTGSGFIFGFVVPVVFNLFVLQHILVKTVLLRAVYELVRRGSGQRGGRLSDCGRWAVVGGWWTVSC